VIRSLDIHTVLPLTNDSLTAELGLRPKRGVLLYGPPGKPPSVVRSRIALEASSF
jgi:ATP-dependent 26S proteasome regulatory subunit